MLNDQSYQQPPLTRCQIRLLAICLHAFPNDHGGEILFMLVEVHQLPAVVAALSAEGMDEMQSVARLLSYLFRYSQTLPDGLRDFLMHYTPHQLSGTIPYVWQHVRKQVADFLLHLLTRADPLLSIEAIARAIPYSSATNMPRYLSILLKADYEHFARVMRQMIRSGDSPLVSQPAAYHHLETMLERDPEGNSDLAAAIFLRNDIDIGQRIGALKLLSKHARNLFYRLIEGAFFLDNPYIVVNSLHLLKEDSSPQAQAILHYAIEVASEHVAVPALQILLAQPLPYRTDYALLLLAHRLKQVRAVVVRWLAQQGEPLIGRLEPLLADPRARLRQEVVYTLRAIGGPRVREILLGHLGNDRAQIVRQAILDAVGVPERYAHAELTIAAITSAAEWTLQQITPAASKLIILEEGHGLRWHDGSAIAPTVIGYLIYSQSRGDENHLLLNDHVRSITMLMAPESRGALAQLIYTTWNEHPRRGQHDWLLPLVATMGDEPLIQQLTDQIRTWAKQSTTIRNRRALPMVNIFARSRNLAALAAVEALCEHRQRGLRATAQRCLFEAMQHMGLTREGLLERLAPCLGFNEQGERKFAYGSRQLTAMMMPTGEIILVDEQGNQYERPPRPRKHDDGECIAAMRAEWKKLKRAYIAASSKQAHNLEQGFVLRRTWSPAQWRTYLLSQPMMRALASRLVWEWRPLNSDPPQDRVLFRPLRDGSLVMHNDASFELPNEGGITLVYLFERGEAGSIWQEHLVRHGIVQPFAQLERVVFQMPPERAQQHWWWPERTLFATARNLKTASAERGWVPGAISGQSYGYSYYRTLWKWFPTAAIVAVIEISDLPVYGNTMKQKIKLIRFGFYAADDVRFAEQPGAWQRTNAGYAIQDDVQGKEEQPLLIGNVPGTIVNEVLHDFWIFAEE